MKLIASLDRRRLVTVVVTLTLAFLSGHLMQSGLSKTAPINPANTTIITDTGQVSAVPGLTDRPQGVPELPVADAAPVLETPPVLPLRVNEARLDRTVGCAPRLEVTPAPAATLRIDLLTPCAANQPVILRHGPLFAEVATDANGAFQTRLPALESPAVVHAALPGLDLTATADMPEYAAFHHVILHWTGAQILELNAYEFGASDWEAGHVWPGAPKSPERALQGRGFLTSLGRPGAHGFQIYSVPLQDLPDTGVIRLAVDAEIQPDTCGRDLTATAYQTGPLGRLSRSDIRVTLPDCDRVGDVLRLQNLFPDMRLASR